MKKNYLRITLVTLAILVLSIVIAMLSVTALDGDEMAVTSEEYEDIFTPLSSEGGLIEEELPSMGEITMGDIIGPSLPVAPNAITTEEIPDGVYALRNVGNTNRWMDMEQNHVEPGKHIQQYAYSSSPATAFSRPGLFKISKKAGTTNYYIIRSMLNNRLSFEIKNNQVITKEIQANDNDVSLLEAFTITYSTNGYVIQPRGSSNAICAPNTTASGGSSSYLIADTVAKAGNRAKWILEPYTGANQSGASFSSPSGLSMGLVEGKAYSVKGYSWTTLINVNKLLLEVPYSYVDTASSVWYGNTEIMRLTLHKAGKFQIYIYIYNEDEYDDTDPNDTPARTFYGNYMSVPPIEDGMNYFIQNVGTKRYMDVEGPSTAEGAIIQQWNFSMALQKKWIFTRESGGYFTIKSAYSNKYVGVDSTNTSVIRQYGTKSDYTLWYFAGTDSDNYSLHCKVSAVTGVLATPTATSGNGVNLVTTAYTDDTNYRDEWKCYISDFDLQIVHFYDRGYTIRYTTNETANSKLRTYDRSVAERLMRLFGVNSISSFSEFESSADRCKIDLTGNLTLACLDNKCTHTDSHLETSDLRNDRDNGTALSPVVIWTGHVLHDGADSNWEPYSIVITDCFKVENKHVDEDGDKDEDYVNCSDEKIKQESEYDLLHELSHQIGAEDHYCYGKNESGKCSNSYCDECVNGYSGPRANCIMGVRHNISQRTDNLLYCNDCISLIQQHIENNQ